MKKKLTKAILFLIAIIGALTSKASTCKDLEVLFSKNKFTETITLADAILKDNPSDMCSFNFLIKSLYSKKSYAEITDRIKPFYNNLTIENRKVLNPEILATLCSFFNEKTFLRNAVFLDQLAAYIMVDENTTKPILGNLFNYYNAIRFNRPYQSEMEVMENQCKKYTLKMQQVAQLYINMEGLNDTASIAMYDFLNRRIPNVAFDGRGSIPKTEGQYMLEEEQNEINYQKLKTTKQAASAKNLGTAFHEFEEHFKEANCYNTLINLDSENSQNYKLLIGAINDLISPEKNNQSNPKAYSGILNNNKNQAEILIGKIIKDAKVILPDDRSPLFINYFSQNLERGIRLFQGDYTLMRSYAELLIKGRQYENAQTFIKKNLIGNGQCKDCSSLLESCHVFLVFNHWSKKDPTKLFDNAFQEKLSFEVINGMLEKVSEQQDVDTNILLFNHLIKSYWPIRDSIDWSYCADLVDEKLNKEQLQLFLEAFKKLKAQSMVEFVEYKIYSNLDYQVVLNAIDQNKISLNVGYDIIAEFGYSYADYNSDDHSAGSDERRQKARKIGLKLMLKAATYKKDDGELFKAIGHCYFFLHQIDIAQVYYKKAASLGANMSDVGAMGGGKSMKTGSKGGKYYMNSNDNKTYVPR